MRGAARLVASAALAVSLLGARGGRDAESILRRAEEVRSPDLDYAVDFTIAVHAPHTVARERRASYTMIAHGKDHSMVLMRTPVQFYGGTLLIDEGLYWLLLPRAEKPFQLMESQVFRGDIGNGDLARANLAAMYAARLAGEEALQGEPCWRLELTRTHNRAHYTRILAWIATDGFLPRKFEYYGETGALLKTARYGDYRRGPLGLRPMRIEVESTHESGRKSTMEFSNLRRIAVRGVEFTPQAMVRFRDAAVAARQGPEDQPPPERFLAALGAGAR
jgi:hypothetical protein